MSRPSSVMNTTPRPLPRLDADNRAFWTGGATGKLLIMRCANCATFFHPPRPVCRNCLSEQVQPEAVRGTGAVDTFTVNYQAWYAGLEVPFVIARVALDGAPGVFLTTNIVGCSTDSVKVGDRVSVTFLRQEDIFIPLFEKIA